MTVSLERPAYVPVALRVRADGWTPARQRAFLEALAATRSVPAAADAAGLSRASAYRLRARADAAAFADAWRAALVRPPCPRAALVRANARALWDGAYRGRTTPIVRAGVVVGARVRLDNAALLTLARRFDHREACPRAPKTVADEKRVSRELRHLPDARASGNATGELVRPRRVEPAFQTETIMTEKKGHGSDTAKKANAKADKEGEKNPRKSSAAQAELGKKGGKAAAK